MPTGHATKLRAVIMAALVIFASCNQPRPSAHQQLRRVKVSQFHMGMMIHLTLWAPTVEVGQQAAVAAFSRIGEIDQIMSDYEADSELSHVCRRSGQGPVPVSEDLFLVLTKARQLAELTAGRYDPTIGPLTRLWREARQTGVPTIQSRIDAAKQLVGYEKLLLDTKSRTVELTHSGMRLDLGSIAKGYAGDEALRILKKRGISSAAYEAGGDKVFGAPPPGEKGWPVEIEAALPKISPLANCAVSISGDSEQFYLHEGKRYGHVIDPKTGSSGILHATCVVIARKGLEADPLSTIGTIMPRASYLAFLRQHFPDVVATVFN